MPSNNVEGRDEASFKLTPSRQDETQWKAQAEKGEQKQMYVRKQP